MKTIRVEYFKTVCGICGFDFVTPQLPVDVYGPVLVLSKYGEIGFVFPDEDAVWEEVASLIDELFEGMNRLRDEKLEVFDLALAETLDVSPRGSRYFVWGRIPCPQCGSFEKASFGPAIPARFKDVEMISVTHREWSGLSQMEKRRRIARAIRSYLATASQKN